MDCRAIKKMIPIYLDGELQPQENQSVKDHLAGCPACQRELEAFNESWDMLGELGDIEPQPGFVGRFWTRLSCEQSWQERFWQGLSESFSKRRLVPALATACVVVIVGSFALRNYFQVRQTNQMLAELNEEDFAMVENIELAENFDLIQEMDFLEDLDIIAGLDILET